MVQDAGNDMVLIGVVHLLIYTQDQRHVFVCGRSGDNHLLYRAAQVLSSVFGVGESPCGFHDNLGSHGFPRELGRVLLCEDLYSATVDLNAIRPGSNLLWQIAENGIVLEKMSQRLWIGKIVDRNKIQIGIVQGCAQNVTANTSETVNANFDCHLASKKAGSKEN